MKVVVGKREVLVITKLSRYFYVITRSNEVN